MGDPEAWRWIWLVATLAFAVGEMATPGSFILLPFAIGSALAAALGFLDVPVAIEWVVFLAGSIGTLVAFRPLSRRLDLDMPDTGVGARRLVGQAAVVIGDIPADGLGLVRVDREDWRAESANGAPIVSGAHVRVADVRGTRVVVAPLDTLSRGDEVRP